MSGAVAFALACSPSGSTRQRTCWTQMCRPRRRAGAGSPVRLLAPAGARYLERAGRSGHVPVPAPAAVFTVKLPVPLIARVRAHAAARADVVGGGRQALEEFWRERIESIHAGERAGGRDRVRLRSPAGRGIVGGLPHLGPRTALRSVRAGRKRVVLMSNAAIYARVSSARQKEQETIGLRPRRCAPRRAAGSGRAGQWVF